MKFDEDGSVYMLFEYKPPASEASMNGFRDYMRANFILFFEGQISPPYRYVFAKNRYPSYDMMNKHSQILSRLFAACPNITFEYASRIPMYDDEIPNCGALIIPTVNDLIMFKMIMS